jgi:hypothetical protein
MRRLGIAASSAALFGSVLLLPAATEAQNAAPGIPGYLDAATGRFTARSSFPAAGSGMAVTGSITVITNVAIDAALQKVPDQTITCMVDISTFDGVANNDVTGTNNVIRAGSRGTCTTTISFIWEVASTTKTMNIMVTVSTGFFGGAASYRSSTSTSIPITTKKLTVTLAL